MSGIPPQFGQALLDEKSAPQAGLSPAPVPSSAPADGSTSSSTGTYMAAVAVLTAVVVLGTLGTTLLVFYRRRRRALANQQAAAACESRLQEEGEAGDAKGIQVPVVIITPDNSLHFGWKVSPGEADVDLAGNSPTDAAATAKPTESESESGSEEGQAPMPVVNVVTPKGARRPLRRPPLVVISVDENYAADRDLEIGGEEQRDKAATSEHNK